ncbi:probable UDP-sugar transporter protein SLC35A4 isoform X2 [Haliotis rufescens]|uniref:probable UDP-sugar transporter protein SLC35A4 isoform X1 n=1 Tax=Haliotis rufescens TaxID=6454 RepID=UPI00201F6687|nr:probable UDP-sugar transporter protein SLC35A4 isoform X1 [Haliotis rufescens]XP_048241371.1 probable UDP-sugar transporter protein SLC35A4 isoform X2 [Haliotis rufescens]
MAQESKKVESVCVSFISDDKHVFRLLLWGILLVTEVFIYSSYTILAHLCLVDGKLPFRSSSVVFSTEVLKIVLSIAMMLPELGRGDITMPSLPNCIPFVVPAVLYCINNNLSVYMQVQMDPTTYQILGNTKVATTAILYRIIIQRKLSGVQWISLGVLSISGILDSYGGMQNKASVWSGEIHLTVTGLLMMCAYCWISGLAGVYTEYILKKQYETSLHVQNTLLYTFGIVLNGGVWAVQEAVSGKEGERRLNLFEGFTFKTWAIVVSLAFNGLIMSAIMKHGSNITRLFIISCAMLVTTLLSVAIFQLALNMYYILAFILVVVALYMYHR